MREDVDSEDFTADVGSITTEPDKVTIQSDEVMSQEVNKDETSADVCDIVHTFEENDTGVTPYPMDVEYHDNAVCVGLFELCRDSVSTDGFMSRGVTEVDWARNTEDVNATTDQPVENNGFDKLRQGDSQFIMRVGGVSLTRCQLESLEPGRLMEAGIIRSYVALHMKQWDLFVKIEGTDIWLNDTSPWIVLGFERILFLRLSHGHFTGFIWFVAKGEIHYYDSVGNPPPNDFREAAERRSLRICSLDHKHQTDGVSCGPLTANFLAGYGDLGFRFPSISPDEMKSLRWKMRQKLVENQEPLSSFCQLCGHTVLQEQYWMCGQCSRAVHFKCSNLSMVPCACHYWSSLFMSRGVTEVDWARNTEDVNATTDQPVENNGIMVPVREDFDYL